MRITDILTLLFWGLFYIFGEGQSLVFIFLAAAFHESAHIFFYYVFKAKIESVRILPYGISASFHSTVRLSYGKEIIALAAGPCFNLLLAAVFFVLSSVGNPQGADIFFIYNFAYFAVNILPIFPLDGGRIVRNFLLKRISERSAVKISEISSLVFLCGLFFAAFLLYVKSGGNFSLILISVYLLVTFFLKKN